MMNTTVRTRWERFIRSPFSFTALAFVLYWFSLDPIRLEFTILLVPTLWYPLYLFKPAVQQDSSATPNRWFRRTIYKILRFPFSFYGQIWLASILFWSVIAFWLTCPHPATILGWLAVAVYIGGYFPVFIALTRTLFRYIPQFALFAPAISWLITEWFRKHLLGGFSFASLEHAFYRRPLLIQTADLFGEYTLGVLIVLFGTGLAVIIIQARSSQYMKVLGLVLYLFLLSTCTILYGAKRLEEYERLERVALASGTRPVRVALLQEETTFRFPVPEETNRRIHESYLNLARQAVEKHGPLDLIVWPESSFAYPWVELKANGTFPEWATLSIEQRKEQAELMIKRRDEMFGRYPELLGTSLLIGTSTVTGDSEGQLEFYNSALFVPLSGTIARYDKMTLVIFGEYLPFSKYLPAWFPLKTLCNSVTPGSDPVAFPLSSCGRTIRVVPNICFESSIPHLVWNQVKRLERNGFDSDLLVNMSNDGWFQYMPQIDYHLAAHVFRAVENRRHFVSATHAGYSVWVDPAGHIRACGQRRTSQAVIADIILLPPHD